MAPNRKSIAAVGVAGLLSSVLVSAEVGQDPTTLTGEEVAGAPTPFCQYPSYEYAARWSIPDPEANDPNSNWGVPAADVVECATICDSTPDCTGATFLAYRAGTEQKACYVKTWPADGPAAVPCQPPENPENYVALIKGDCGAIQFMESTVMDCAEESEMLKYALQTAMAPAEGPSMAPTEIEGYQVYLDRDYVPKEGLTTEYDIEGINVESAEMCAEECNARATAPQPCNAFSWYGDATLDQPFTFVCYLKYVPECMLPVDATQHTDGRIVAIMNPETCPAPPTTTATTPAPAPAETMVAQAPFNGQTTAEMTPQEAANSATGLHNVVLSAIAAVAFAMYLA